MTGTHARPGSAAARIRVLLGTPIGALDGPFTADVVAVLDVLDVLADLTEHAQRGGRFVDPHVLRDALAEVLSPAPAAAAAREGERRARALALAAELGMAPEPPVITAVHQLLDREHLLRAATETCTLGELTYALEAAPATALVRFAGAGLDGQVPAGVDSWRGVYADLALGHVHPADRSAGRPAAPPMNTVAELLALARHADGSTFQGWKGGDYTMGPATPVWVDNPGRSGGPGIRSVELVDGVVVITVAARP